MLDTWGFIIICYLVSSPIILFALLIKHRWKTTDDFNDLRTELVKKIEDIKLSQKKK